MKLFAIRKEYKLAQLDIDTVTPDPIIQLEQWLGDAANAKCPDYTAMTLATSNTDGQPSTRVVLLKYLKKEGLFFFTNYKSRKGKDLLLNPKAAANFFWPELERQVKIEGHVIKAEAEISDFYFRMRPYESQISAVISPQSAEIPDRKLLEKEWQEMYNSMKGKEIERPEFWGGFMLKPTRVEFWQGREHRLHDRIVYKKQAGGWKIKRLAP